MPSAPASCRSIIFWVTCSGVPTMGMPQKPATMPSRIFRSSIVQSVLWECCLLRPVMFAAPSRSAAWRWT